MPIDQIPYNSTTTAYIEYLPIAVGFMPHVGCDYMLLELIERLAKYLSQYLKDIINDI